MLTPLSNVCASHLHMLPGTATQVIDYQDTSNAEAGDSSET